MLDLGALVSRRLLLLLALLLTVGAPLPAAAQRLPAAAQRQKQAPPTARLARLSQQVRARLRRFAIKKSKQVRSQVRSTLQRHEPAVERVWWRGTGIVRNAIRGPDRRIGATSAADRANRTRALSRELTRAGVATDQLAGVLEHVALGMPSRATTRNPDDRLMPEEGYVASYNRQRKSPNWVAAKLTRSDITGPYNKRLRFRRNQKINPDWDPASPSDYKGVYARERLTRGHLIGSGDQTGDVESHKDTYLLSNQVPQLYDNNAGPWHDFELHVRGEATKNDVYVFAGGLYDNDSRTIGTNRVAVPKATWKVAVVVPPGHSPDSPAAKVMYLIVPNEAGKVKLNETFEKYLVTGPEMERATGHRFFTNLPEGSRQSMLASTYRPHVPVHYFSRRKLAEIRKLGLEVPKNVELNPQEMTARERVGHAARMGTRKVQSFFRRPAE